MYVPPAFAETDMVRLHEFIERYSFAVLVSQAEGEPVASHLPLLLDRKAESQGRLVGHMARSNPQWQDAEGQTVLAAFTGPHAYVSPSWYETADVVPTWNYVAVHVTGRLRLIDDPARLLEVVRRTVEVYEAPMPRPWSLDSADPVFIEKLLQGIVGFEIEIERIEGKWKLSQNHTPERRRRVIQALESRGMKDAGVIARLMADTLGGQGVTVMEGEPVGTTRPVRRDAGAINDLTCRPTTVDDVPLLARMNKELVEDEGSRNPMSVADLEDRMRGWLEGNWRAAVFEQGGEPVGYCLYQVRSDEYRPADAVLYLRQFFVGRDHRSRGVGRRAFEAVARTCFPEGASVVLDVLETNPGARRFWESLGFHPYCTTMKLVKGGPAGGEGPISGFRPQTPPADS